MNRKSVFFISIIFILFGACDTGKIYEGFYTADTKGWHKDSMAVFNFNIQDSSAIYDLLVNTRNLENYPFSNLWLFVDIVAPDSTTVRDTIEYQLAQPNGKWLGTGTGGVYFNSFNYRSKVYFPQSGEYKIKIQHGMRDVSLKGLKNIGLSVAKRD